MTDLRIEETCPCGNRISLSGFTRQVEDRIAQWHGVHDKHANAISRAIVQAKEKQAERRVTWPFTATYETQMGPQS